MTFKDKAQQMLTECGMFDNQADAVIERVIAAPENEAMRGRWNDDTEGYPPVMFNVLWLTVKRHALEYIEETCPQAWFKPMFEETAEANTNA
jgi:hypothetical protein